LERQFEKKTPSRRLLQIYFAGEEEAVGVGFVVGEGGAGLEAEFLVESLGGGEERAGAGFEAEAMVIASAGLGDDVGEEICGDAFPEVGGDGAHGFYFGVSGIEFFERAAAHEVGWIGFGPDAPESDVRFAQRIEVESVHAARLGNRGEMGEVVTEKFLDFGAVQIVKLDGHKLKRNGSDGGGNEGERLGKWEGD